MNKNDIMQRLSECCIPWEKGGYCDYMHPNYLIKDIADWKIRANELKSYDNFWIAGLGKLTNTQKLNVKKLILFLKKYKIRGVGGKEDNALGSGSLLAIKREDYKDVEVFWLFGNGTNGFDNDFLPAAKECLKMIKYIRKQPYIKNAYLLNYCADILDDTYAWYIKIVI